MTLTVDNSSFNCQYAQNYFNNIAQLSSCYLGGLSREDRALAVMKLSELSPERESIVIGTFFTDDIDRSEVIKNFIEGRFDGTTRVKKDKVTYFMEDDTSRCSASFADSTLVPECGLVICARGRLDNGEFKISKLYTPPPAPQRPLQPGHEPLVMAINGLPSSVDARSFLAIIESVKNIRPTRVLVFGPLADPSSKKEEIYRDLTRAEALLWALSQISAVHIIPQEGDYTSRCYPLAPVNDKLFPAVNASTTHFEANPASFSIEGTRYMIVGLIISVLALSNRLMGQRVALDTVANSLRFRQLCPQAPDRIISRPSKGESLFFLKERPHVVLCADDSRNSVEWGNSEGTTVVLLPPYQLSNAMAIITGGKVSQLSFTKC